jgi:hypothetical protein
MQNSGKNLNFIMYFLYFYYKINLLITVLKCIKINHNKDDAKSSSIQIIFETENNAVKRILFKNNGIYFRLEDWNRLKKIAEGNPDEQKVSFFLLMSQQ